MVWVRSSWTNFCIDKETYMQIIPIPFDESEKLNTYKYLLRISLKNWNSVLLFQNIYAFSIKPLIHLSREELIKQPDDVTECPYTETGISSNNSSKHQVG